MNGKISRADFFKRKGRFSHVWKGIMQSGHMVAKGTKWRIGNGQNISFWYDWWCGNTNLMSMVKNEHVDIDPNLKVENLFDVHCGWKKDILS